MQLIFLRLLMAALTR